MIKVSNHSVVYENGAFRPAAGADRAAGRTKTMAHGILSSHNTSGSEDALQLKMDAMASHDITYVGIIQTARASGLQGVPPALCADQLPQLPVRCRRHHQRG